VIVEIHVELTGYAHRLGRTRPRRARNGLTPGGLGAARKGERVRHGP
jgi:hypothetical protein